VNHSRPRNAGGVGTLAPAALLRAAVGTVITELRSIAETNGREAAAVIVEPSDPDPSPLTATAMKRRTHVTASTGHAVPRHVVAGLPHALRPIALRLRDADTLPLWIGSVQEQIAGRPVRMPATTDPFQGPAAGGAGQ